MQKIIVSTIFIVLSCFGFRTVFSQSLIPCDLTCATTEISGDVTLEWILSTEACGAFIEYIIYAGDGTGSFTILDFIFSESTTTYTHSGADGTVNTWCYYIEAVYDCPGYLISQSDTLCNTDPEAPALDYVSVIPPGVSVNWLPSTSSKTDAYIIYRDIGGFAAIDTVFGRFTTTYIDVTSNAVSQVETYTIASMDACENVGPFNENAHHTILLSGDQEGCTNSMDLSWNAYDNWLSGVLEYQLWVSVNFTTPVLVASLPASTTSYVYTGLNDSDHFDFTIYAVRGDNTAESHSNTIGFNVEVTLAAQYNVMRNVTANADAVDIGWYQDADADLRDYSILRSENNIDYAHIFDALVTNPIASPDLYNDVSADPGSSSYYYKVITADSCGVELTSGYARTILLQGIANDNFTNDLNWNAYEMTNATISGYTVYRNEGTSMAPLATLDASVLSFKDDVAPIITLTDSACYYIEATYTLSTTLPDINEQLVSHSNRICLEQDPKVYVPNAIIPGTANGIFKPVIIFGDENSFRMQIFNRYGEIIFESDNSNDGWDGTFKGDIVPLGTYAYLISFTANDGELIKKKGNVSVIK